MMRTVTHNRLRRGRTITIALICLGFLAGCASNQQLIGSPPTLSPNMPVTKKLVQLPPPDRPIDVGVYAFPDLTGQYKANDNFSELSTAVTQGAVNFLIEALVRAGNGAWFSVVERTGLNNLMQERRIIRGMRAQFEGRNAETLPPLRFAGIMLEGGIVSYDTNMVTGGAGARYLGIGLDTQYRRDVVTVALRAISVQSGRVLAAVSTTKTVFSLSVRNNVFRFVAIDELLELEAGFAINEPPQLAVRQAVELAVYALVLEGAQKGLWSFQRQEQNAYYQEIYGEARNSGITHERKPKLIPGFGQPPAWLDEIENENAL